MFNANVKAAESRRPGHTWILCLLALISMQCLAFWLFVSCPSVEVLSPITPTPNTTTSESAASQESFGFFYDITDENWNLLRQIYRDHSNHLNPDRPLLYNPQNEDKQGIETWGDPEMFSSYKAWYQSNYEPNFSCQFEKRVGKNMNGDGPKWVVC
mmetsp:Transcript_27337/g.57717  ORF Transcript_27337/g.57717 Transcript_27337/m.57717 type:complete len:156 (-) Transcript_27337:1794-2261(-)